MGGMVGAGKPHSLSGISLQHIPKYLSNFWGLDQSGLSSAVCTRREHCQHSDVELDIRFLFLSGQQLCLRFRREATVHTARQHIAFLCCVPKQAVQLLCAGRLLQEEVQLASLGGDCVQVIFNASCLRKGGPPAQLAKLGVWHGLKVRSWLLNSVATESHGVLRQSHSLRGDRMSFHYSAKDADGSYALVSSRRKGHAVCRQFALGIEGLDQYRGRIYRCLPDKEYLLCDGLGGQSFAGRKKAALSEMEMPHSDTREMGLLHFKTKRRVGRLHIEFAMPPSMQDFDQTAMLPQPLWKLYRERRWEELHVLSGTADDGTVELLLDGECIFEAKCLSDALWEVRFGPPLSHFQALGIMTGVLDNASSASFHK
eukprot:s2007_g8.t1